MQGAGSVAATSALAGPGLAVILVPIAAGALALLVAAFVCRRRLCAARLAALVTHEQRVANPASPDATGELVWTLSPKPKLPSSSEQQHI